MMTKMKRAIIAFVISNSVCLDTDVLSTLYYLENRLVRQYTIV